MDIGYRIGFLGSRDTGKTTFLNRIVNIEDGETKKQESKLEVVTVQMDIMGKKQEITIKDIKGDILLSDQSSNVELSYRNSKIIIIFFNVNNWKSYEDVRNTWIPFVTKSEILQKCTLVLLANKVDLIPAMTYQAIQQLASNNSIKVYYCYQSMCASHILQKIIMDYQVAEQVNNLMKVQPTKTKKGFFSNLFSGSKQMDPILSKKIKELDDLSWKRISAMKEQFNHRNKSYYKKIEKELLEMYKQLMGKSLETNKKIHDFEYLVGLIKQNIKKELMDRKEEALRVQNELRHLKKQHERKVIEFSEWKEQQVRLYNSKLELLSRTSSQKQKTINQLAQKQLSLGRKITFLQQKNQQLSTNLSILQYSLKEKDEKIKQRDEELRETRNIHNSAFRASSIGVSGQTKIFLGLSTLRDSSLDASTYGFQLHKTLSFFYSNYLNKKNEDTEKTYSLIKCEKLYNYSPTSKSFHAEIDGKSNLFICLKFNKINLIIFTPEEYSRKNICKQGIVIVDVNNDLRAFQQLENAKFLRYDLLKLILGEMELIIEITKQKCAITLYQKNISLFDCEDKVSLLGLEGFGKPINVDQLEISELFFEEI